MRLRLILAAALLTLTAAMLPVQPAAAQAQRDWTRVVAQTPEGGFRMGNPNAPVKVVEFLSLTCPHCAHFAEEGAPQLIQDHVRSGRVSLEYRNFVLNAYDLAASFLSRCAAPQHYFALNHAILASQDEWMGRVEALSDEQRRQLQEVQPIQGMQRIVALAGLDAIAARHGINAAQARACLGNQAALDRIVAMRRAAESLGVDGTPTFAINGRVAADVHDWASLEPLLRAAR
ncbi:MAG TPA: thioredoxin domain-containing protein [Allosphingosinicella sp.]|nr:thioredoxin domain-containing protein [Allosphingosinicella sp.]